MIPRDTLRRIQVVTRRLATAQLSGQYHSVVRGQGLAFREVREYQPGDDVRRIDWNVSARMTDAFVKVFVEEREMTVMLLVDISASSLFGTRVRSKTRLAAEAAATLAFSAARNGDRIGLVMSSDRVERVIAPKRGDRHAMRVVKEVLERTPLSPRTDLRVSLEALHRTVRRRCVAFLMSDFFAEGYERALALVAAHHDLVPMVLVDPRDRVLPDVGLASFEDLETGETITLDTSSRAVREHFAAESKRRHDAVIGQFRRLGLDHCVLRTDGSYVEPLRELFRRRARRLHR